MNKYLKSMSEPAKASILYVICSVLQKGISFITIPIFTRMMTTEQYGVYTLYVSWSGIFEVFATLCLYYAVYNKSIIKFEQNIYAVTSAFLGLITCISSGAFACLFLLYRFVGNWIDLPIGFLFLMFIELVTSSATKFWLAINRFSYKYRSVVTVSILMSLLNPALGLLLVFMSDNKANARIFSSAAVNITFGMIFYGYFMMKGRKFFSKEYWGYALKFNIPLIPHYFSGVLLMQADRVMINYFCGSSDAAIYSVAYTTAMTTQIISDSVNASFMPWLYKRIKSGNKKDIKHISNMILFMIFSLIEFLVLLAPEIVFILGGEKYREAVNVIPYVATSVYFMFLFGLFVNIEFYYDKNKYVFVATLVSAIINILLNLYCIPKFGFVAAGMTTLVSYCVFAILHYLFMKIVLKQVQEISVYDERFCFILSVISIIMCILMNIGYKYTFLRWGLILIVMLTFVINRRKIINLVKEIK